MTRVSLFGPLDPYKLRLGLKRAVFVSLQAEPNLVHVDQVTNRHKPVLGLTGIPRLIHRFVTIPGIKLSSSHNVVDEEL